MALYGVRLLLNLFGLMIYRRYLETYIGSRRSGTKLTLLVMGICAGVCGFVDSMGKPVLNLLNTVIILWGFSLLYTEKVRARALAIFIYLGLEFLTEPIGYVMYLIVIQFFYKDDVVSYFLLAFLMKLVHLAVIEIFCRIHAGRKMSLAVLPEAVAGLLYGIPLTSIVCCILLIEIAGYAVSGEVVVLCLTVIFIILVCNYMVFLMVEKYTELIKKEQEEEMTRQEAAYLEAYYADLESYVDKINAIRHDMKNQLLAVYDTAKGAGVRDIEVVLLGMLQEIQAADEEVYSSNPVLNSILKVKAGKAKQYGIEVKIDAFIPQKISVDNGDMGILVGNLLDNAIEACEKIIVGGEYIDFWIKYQKGNLLLQMVNSKQEQPNPKFQTEKEDKRRHGRGLRSVERTAEKYGGVLLLEDRGTSFETRLMLTGISYEE